MRAGAVSELVEEGDVEVGALRVGRVGVGQAAHVRQINRRVRFKVLSPQQRRLSPQASIQYGRLGRRTGMRVW